jgi:SAM-dependent methyltransferase
LPTWLLPIAFLVAALLAFTALFFFTFTRGALILRSVTGVKPGAAAHVYPIYSNMRLIRLIDFQPIISAILLFQYGRLVSMITHGLRQMNLRDKDLLITSFAFGDVIPRVVGAADHAGVHQVLIADIIKNELVHAQGKLPEFAGRLRCLEENACALSLRDGAVAANVLFFLLHELPHPLKGQVLAEAVRLVEPGGKLYIAEFHRPRLWVLRALSWTYFKVFEPYGLALWDSHDPLRHLEAMGGLKCTRHTVFFGNFQIVEATKQAA